MRDGLLQIQGVAQTYIHARQQVNSLFLSQVRYTFHVILQRIRDSVEHSFLLVKRRMGKHFFSTVHWKELEILTSNLNRFVVINVNI